MKLFLFGGAEIDFPLRSVSILKNLIKDSILQVKPKSILHVPFARLHAIPEDKGEWDEGWFKKLLADTGIEIFDARNQLDIDKAKGSVIFINGGPERKTLVDTVSKNSKLLQKILNANYIIAESAGSMAMGEYMRISRTDNNVMKGFGVLKDVVIEPHYTEKNYKQYLPGDMEKSGVRYGIGIDSATGIILDTQEFPDKWEKIGAGNIYLKTA
jgi:cyanophycinase-like exopeptidase